MTEYTEEQLKKEYVVVKHLTMPDKGICFFTSNSELGRDCTDLHGNVVYENVAFADTVEEAQSYVRQLSTYPTMREMEEHYKNRTR